MRVELHRIAGDIYINGEKKIFACDFNSRDPHLIEKAHNIDWLIGWAKIGLISKGHTVPHFQPKDIKEFGNNHPMVGEKSQGNTRYE